MVGGKVDEEARSRRAGLHVTYQALKPRHGLGLVEHIKWQRGCHRPQPLIDLRLACRRRFINWRAAGWVECRRGNLMNAWHVLDTRKDVISTGDEEGDAYQVIQASRTIYRDSFHTWNVLY